MNIYGNNLGVKGLLLEGMELFVLVKSADVF